MKTETLINVTVPLFLLSGMEKKDNNFVAKVVSHEGKALTLDVSGTEAKTEVADQKKYFKKGVSLIFNSDGLLIATEVEGSVYKASATERVAASPAPRSTGSNEYRKNKLF